MIIHKSIVNKSFAKTSLFFEFKEDGWAHSCLLFQRVSNFCVKLLNGMKSVLSRVADTSNKVGIIRDRKNL
jgi:hypothetical protein